MSYKTNEMINSLSKIFKDLELSWIDSSKDIVISNAYRDLLSIFPNLQEVFQEGQERDDEEFIRTIRHVFRVIKIFFSIKDGGFSSDTLSQESIQKIKVLILKQFDQNELILPLILIYHDIGRFFDKKNHPNQSYLLISERNLLEPFELSDIDKMLVSKVIQYHLLFAAIYTGEATFYGAYSLFNDNEFIKFISNQKFRDNFADLLEIFTYLDVLGYSYAKIFDHYSNYYNDINCELKSILNIWPNKSSALKRALETSQEWLEWRIAGALRIFQFVDTKPYLTSEFYFNKLKESIKETNNDFINTQDWETIKKKYLIHSNFVQLKYGLGITMILAFGDFFRPRSRIKKDAKISYRLLLFWILISKEISSRSNADNNTLWNVFFTGLPYYSKMNKKFIAKLDDNAIEQIIKNAIHDFDEEKKEFNLYLDFKI